jgi:hypothetical protein
MTEIQTIDGRSLKPLLQKLNPIWWFQNDDEQHVSDAPWYHPEWPQWRREFYWNFLRNPLQNFRCYVLGVADELHRCGQNASDDGAARRPCAT